MREEPRIWLAPGMGNRLRATVRRAWEKSPAARLRLQAAGLNPDKIRGPGDLAALPVLRKEDLVRHQAAELPFGGLLGQEVGELQRIFVSPGPIYDPQGQGDDYWRFAPALAAAGFVAGDVVMNCFSYHLSPAGFMLDAGLRALGCVVIPAGVGQQELQARVLAATRATGFVGLPSYLLSLLERAKAEGQSLSLERAWVTAEPPAPSLRRQLAGYGVEVFQGYGTADLGSVAYECHEHDGLHLDTGVMVEICDPEGRPVPAGEVGEVVVSLLNDTYPLLRFGTGDLSALVTEPCACGRGEPRLRGWLGRAGEAVKVRGLFVYPHQIEQALANHPGLASWQAMVERDADHRDRLLVRVQPVPGAAPDLAAVAAAVKATTRLGVEVEVGDVPADARRLEDRRRWE